MAVFARKSFFKKENKKEAFGNISNKVFKKTKTQK